jgi:hypothetical protein
MYICPIVLSLMLASICSFLALVRHGTDRIERGPAPESYGDVDAWRASLDVELGDAWFQPARTRTPRRALPTYRSVRRALAMPRGPGRVGRAVMPWIHDASR